MRINSYTLNLKSAYAHTTTSASYQTSGGENAQIKIITNEKENLELAADGKVSTEKGDLFISSTASLLYQNQTTIQMSVQELKKMADPLVINFKGELASVERSAKFGFDIDIDGKEDAISLLTGGNGFLAFDRNNDGTINDGSELFGAKSGNGFAELAAYDDTKDGVIDENDEIFSKLKIWLKTVSKDELMSLKEARVGALLLDNISSEFSIRGDNGVNAKIQKSGVALSEDGKAMWMSHVDFAINDEGQKSQIDRDTAVDAMANTINRATNSDTRTSSIEKTVQELQDKLEEVEAKLLKTTEENELKTLKLEKARLTQQIVALENMIKA